MDNIELLKAYKDGDMAARDRLVEVNRGLVHSVANHYSCDGSIDYEDLIQEGYIGLLKAIEYFDLSKEFAFSTYAIYWIKQKIFRFIENNKRAIRIPVHSLGEVRKIKKAFSELAQMLNKQPSIYDVALYLDMEPIRVEFLVHLNSDIKSLDEPVGSEDDEYTLMDTVDSKLSSPEETVVNTEYEKGLKKDIKTWVSTVLNTREQEVIDMYYGFCGDCKTLEYISKQLGVTKERVRQINAGALRMLRKKSYLIKDKIEFNIDLKTDFYRKGFNPVEKNFFERENERKRLIHRHEHPFYKWVNQLRAEKSKMERLILPYSEDRVQDIDTILMNIDRELEKLVFCSNCIAGWLIVRNKIRGFEPTIPSISLDREALEEENRIITFLSDTLQTINIKPFAC